MKSEDKQDYIISFGSKIDQVSGEQILLQGLGNTTSLLAENNKYVVSKNQLETLRILGLKFKVQEED
jgi:hypothetical protein